LPRIGTLLALVPCSGGGATHRPTAVRRRRPGVELNPGPRLDVCRPCALRARPGERGRAPLHEVTVIAQLDKFIQVLFTRQGTLLTLGSGQPPTLIVKGRPAQMMPQTPTATQLRRLIAEVIPSSVHNELTGTGRAGFDYTLPSGETVSIDVTEWNGDTRIELRPRAVEEELPQPELPPLSPRDLGPRGAAPPQRPPSSTALPPINGQRPPGEPPPPPPIREAGVSSLRPAVSVENERAIDRLFRAMVALGASDLHLSSNEIPMVRKDGDMVRIQGESRMSAEELFLLLEPIIPEANRRQFEAEDDTDFAYEIQGLARFRANLFRDRFGAGAVFRTIPAKILSAETLGLSDAIKDLCKLHKGLVLVTGPTGSGKSTTLCAMVDLINRQRSGHIITIEDPIEFVHENKSCLVNQREIGRHTKSFKRALRAALREDPDVVLVGEMRDLETISIAIETAETGHLVFGTLHTTTAYSTIDRIIDQYPPDQQEQIRVMLSESLKGVVSQTLCKKISGGRAAALEVLLVTPAVSNLIREGKTFQIPSIMQTARGMGMRLLNDALAELVENKIVSADEAISKAVDKTGLKTQLKNKDL
jgi:twitching motility protein PilT